MQHKAILMIAGQSPALIGSWYQVEQAREANDGALELKGNAWKIVSDRNQSLDHDQILILNASLTGNNALQG